MLIRKLLAVALLVFSTSAFAIECPTNCSCVCTTPPVITTPIVAPPVITTPVITTPVVVVPTVPWTVVVAPVGLTFPTYWDGAPLNSQAELDDYVRRVNDRSKNLYLQNQQTANTRYTGPIGAASLSDEDSRYLYAISNRYNDGNIYYVLLNGYHADISRAINRGFDLNNGFNGDPIGSYNGILKRYVEAYLASKQR
jgi:hypothetical protein